MKKKNRILHKFGIHHDGTRYVFSAWGIGAWISRTLGPIAYRYIKRFGTEEQQKSLSLWWDYEKLGILTEKAYSYKPGKVGFLTSLAAAR